jgi:hypothetical protein
VAGRAICKGGEPPFPGQPSAELAVVTRVDPREVAQQVADAIRAGDLEVLADDVTRTLKSKPSEDVTAPLPRNRRSPAA